MLPDWSPHCRPPVQHLCWGCGYTTWYSGWACGKREVYPLQFNGIPRRLKRGNVERQKLVSFRTFMTLSECLQRSDHLEEPQSPEYITSPRRRSVHSAALHHLGMDGTRKFEGVSHSCTKRPEVKIGKYSLVYTLTDLTGNQLLDASQGLEYMHRLGCIHGDLKAVRLLSPKSSPAPDTPS